MAYIETHQSLLTHRKTLRLGRLLQMDKFAVVGRLAALWCWALDNAPDGEVAIGDSDILADVMGWDGEPQALCEALVSAGFLDRAENAYLLHDWYDYAGRLIEKRRENADRMRAARAQKDTRDDGQRATHVQRTSSARAGATVPNRSAPYPNEPSPKGESVSNPTGDGGSEPPQATPAQPAASPIGASASDAAACDDVAFTHLCAEVAQVANLTAAPEKVAHLLKQHPKLPRDRIVFETEMAAEWIADPNRNKKKRTMSVSFLNNWLSKASEPPQLRVVNGNGNGNGAAAAPGTMPRASPPEPERVFRDARTITITPRPASLDNLPPPPLPKHAQNHA